MKSSFLAASAAAWLACSAAGPAAAFSAARLQAARCIGVGSSPSSTALSGSSRDDAVAVEPSPSGGSRRAFLSKTVAVVAASSPLAASAASVPVQRAVGSAESKCREEGNCLETFELDGAVGWNWGGTERCDASDPLCGPDGRLREEALRGAPVPSDAGLLITHVVYLALTIGTGSNAESKTVKMGLYGNSCPELVKEMTDLCSRTGIVTSKDLLLGAPVRLGVGGSMTYILPEARVEFGVSSQKQAYAKSIRKSKAPDEFVPQGRPGGTRLDSVRGESSSRPHDAAGLVSLPKDGIGYGGGLVLGKDDEAYASAFQITARPCPEMDKEGRKVVGQLLDAESMDVLARLAGSPTRKMVPGQNGGSPLIKTQVDDCAVYSPAELAAAAKEA